MSRLFITDPGILLREFERAVSGKLGRSPRLGLPFIAGDADAQTRARLVSEEADELVQALMHEDAAAVFKEALDLIYVTLGTTEAYGLPWVTGFLRVHDNNMAKIDGSSFDGQKLIKPKDHPKVILTDLLPGAV